VKLHFVTTAAEARCPKSGARLLTNATPGGWAWQVFLPRADGTTLRIGHGSEKTDADARGEARKALARYLGKKSATPEEKA
jgi:hypothetical protein